MDLAPACCDTCLLHTYHIQNVIYFFMKNKISLLLLSSLIFIGISSFISNPVPDPEAFGKEFIETIKKKSRTVYLNKYSMSKQDISWITTQLLSNPYVSEEMKKNYQEKIHDSSITIKMVQALNKNYDNIEAWIKKDTIDSSQLNYIQTFYKISNSSNTTFNVLDGIILVKHKASYYKISIDGAAFINNRWVYGERIQISKVDQYLNDVSDYNDIVDSYDEETGYDTVVIVPADTTAITYQLYSDELVIDNNTNRYSGLHPKQAKKIEKMQKQIDALYIKMDKEYSKEY
ncbi:conserved hypothetical protein [Cytophaga hutchinsonii ATCC 33406]|uniref:Uncharacterized protein n=2 Tax=Cytophaga hutchinsonii TaxID=985 RepID=A0A6N4SU70_CYTH3|nr:conserved hypothetical protein [Cytophaga hutchinsonii ATCC 33406]